MVSNFRTDINAFIDANLSPAARSAALATLARTERDALIQSGNASRTYVTTVDGRVNANEDDVKGTGGGIINYHFSFIGDAAQFAMAFLKGRVPVTTGQLSNSFWLSVNGSYYAPPVTIDYKNIPTNAEIVIGNTAAYWRRAETASEGSRTLRYRQPHELDDCVRALITQFGRTAITAKRLNDYNFPSKYQPRPSRSRPSYRYQSPVLVINAVA